MDRRFKAWLAAAALALAAAPALAQHPAMPADRAQEAAPSLPESLTAGEVRDVVSRLSDEQVRSLLIQQLDKVATADAPAEGSAADQLVAAGDRAHENLVATLDTAPRFGSALAAAWETFTQGVDIGSGRIALAVLLAIVATIVAERVFVSLVGSIGRGGSPDHARGALSRCGLLAARMVCDLLAIGAGLLAAAGVLFVVLSSAEHAPQVLARVFGAVAIIRGAAAISKAVLAPRTPWLRPLPISDAIARGVHARFVLFVALWFLSGLPARSLAVLGAEPRVIGLVNLVTSVVLIGGLVAMALQARVPVARYIRSAAGEGGGLMETLANRWHIFVTIYLVGLWVLAMGVRLGTGEDVSGRAIASLALLAAVPVADSALRTLCATLLAPKPAEPAPAAADGAEDDESTIILQDLAETGPPVAGPFERAMVRNGRILLALVAILTFAGIWNLNLQAVAQGLVGGRLAASLFEILITLILAYAVWSLVKAGVAHLLGEEPVDKGEEQDSGELEIGGPGLSRVATLLPLLRKVVAIALIVMVVMIVLSALGVNIGPLLAGAGMLGLAIGFGAQTLVKDVISGFFFLLDDAFRMGEYVEIDAIRGSVERISVRSLQLRHHNGPVHTLPFGDIRHITNYSRDWAIMKFEIRLPFETDINKVRKIIKKIGQEMMEDEALSKGLLQPLKSQGVNRMDDSALIVRCKFTSKPGEQFVLRREAYTRIQTALAAEGIHFAPRRVIVETAGGKPPTDAELQAAAGSDDSPQPAAGAGGGPG